MQGHLEIWGSRGSARVALDRGRAILGKAPDNDIVITGDSSVSRVHAVVEAEGSVWIVTDLGSRNGTWLNGERLVTPHVLRDGDELRLGRTRIVFMAGRSGDHLSETSPAESPPPLTRRDREVLVALCRPVMQGTLLTAPASVREMAQALFVSESAVKKALSRLYDKFDLVGPERRTGRLAAEAIRRGAVGSADIVLR